MEKQRFWRKNQLKRSPDEQVIAGQSFRIAIGVRGGGALCRRRPAAGPPGFCRALRDEDFAVRMDSFGGLELRQSPVKDAAAVSFRSRWMR